jgi:hypothetical protein
MAAALSEETYSPARASAPPAPPVRPTRPNFQTRIIGAGRAAPAARPAPSVQGPAMAQGAGPLPPRMAGPAPAIRTEASAVAPGGDDNYLDIPAFLRRQAN